MQEKLIAKFRNPGSESCTEIYKKGRAYLMYAGATQIHEFASVNDLFKYLASDMDNLARRIESDQKTKEALAEDCRAKQTLLRSFEHFFYDTKSDTILFKGNEYRGVSHLKAWTGVAAAAFIANVIYGIWNVI